MSAYSIHKHQFNFAIWAASRAYARGVAETSMSITSKTVEKAALRKITGPEHIGDFELLDLEKPDKLDESNRAAVVDAWTVALIESIQAHSKAFRNKSNTPFPFGCAAKLLSVYLKAVLLNQGNLSHPNTALIHPPIDDILLKAVARKLKNLKDDSEAYKTFFDAMKSVTEKESAYGFSWQNMSQKNYLKIIAAFRLKLAGKPLWMIEEDWNVTGNNQ